MNVKSFRAGGGLRRGRGRSVLALAALVAVGVLSAAGSSLGAAPPTQMWGWGDGALPLNPSGGAVTAIPGLPDVVAVAGGSGTSLALHADGTVSSWSTSESVAPVAGLSGITAISRYGGHSLALKSDGTVWAWGFNFFGQLGDGTTDPSATPVQLSGLPPATAISAGRQYSLAVAMDGSVWAWGANFDGQLGDGTTSPQLSPVEITALPVAAVAVAAGARHSLALGVDGTVWAWGNNDAGQLGNGTTTPELTPVQTSGILNAVAVAATGNDEPHSLALLGDGTVMSWGSPATGALGRSISTLAQSRTPGLVSGLAGVTAIAADGDGFENWNLALRGDGTVWMWGDDCCGQRGDLSFSGPVTTAVPISGLANITAIGAGRLHGLAVEALPAPADADDDGVVDDIDVGDGAFDDGNGTTGSIVDAAGLDVTVESDPGGVKITVAGTGATPAKLAVCGFSLLIPAGSTVIASCGSITVEVTDGGPVDVVLADGLTVVSVGTGATAWIDDNGDGTFAVENQGGGTVTVTVDGVSTPVPEGPAQDFAAWDFQDFAAPIDNPPTMNVVKAGKAVPLKWRVVDASGAPVTTLTAATLKATGLACDLAGSLDQVEETASGSSGLQNLGDGYYQLNWKSPAGYANSCKTLTVDLGLGLRAQALFRFTK